MANTAFLPRLLFATSVAASLLIVAWISSQRSHNFQAINETNLQFRRSLTTNTVISHNLSVFKILQVTDMHLGEAENTDWGPQQDVWSFLLLDALMEYEKPDLIILSGDQLTANNVNKNATSYYQKLGNKLSTYGIPWALTFGNHDDAPYEVGLPDGSIRKYPAKTSRRQLLSAIQKFPLSLTQAGPTNIFGASNYVLYVNGENGARSAQIVILDSGGGSLPEQLQYNQITWLRQQMSKTLPVIVFQHIPSDFKSFGFVKSRCQGFQGEGVAPLSKDPGIVQTLLNAGNVHFLAVGHNHGNDYCCHIPPSSPAKPQVLNVCFGRHTGYGGYGSWDRGARVYELHLSQQGKFSWKSWVRLAFGQIIDEFSP